jgi:hypothetical protein
MRAQFVCATAGGARRRLLCRRAYLFRATRRVGRSSGGFGCEAAASIWRALSVPAAMVCNMLRSTLLSALRGNSSTLLRERRMLRLLAEYAPGASKHLLELCSLADFPLLICGTQIGRLKTVAVRLLRPESACQ